MYSCDDEPGPWAEDADDVEVAVNETERTYAGRSCRTQLRRVCLTNKVANQVIGECPNAALRPTSSSLLPGAPILGQLVGTG